MKTKNPGCSRGLEVSGRAWRYAWIVSLGCMGFESPPLHLPPKNSYDPLFKLNIAGEENSTRDQTVFFLELDRLTTEAGCTAILNDHSGKGNQSEKDPLDVIRGSSAKGGDLDAAMVLRKHEVEHCFRVDMVHHYRLHRSWRCCGYSDQHQRFDGHKHRG